MAKRFARRLGRTLITLFVTYVVILSVILGVLFLAPELWSPPLREQIEKRLREKAGIEVVIERLRLVGLWPLTIRLDNVQLKPSANGLSGQIAALDLSIKGESIAGNWLRPKMVLALKMHAPHFQLVKTTIQAHATDSSPQSGGEESSMIPALLKVRPVGLDVGLQVRVEEGQIELNNLAAPVRLHQFSFDLEVPSLRESWWRPTMKTGMKVETSVAGTSLNLPIMLDIQGSSLNPQSFNFDKVILNVANLQMSGKGQRLWQEDTDEFQFTLQPVDLQQLPPVFLPQGQWQGAFSGGFTYKRKGDALPEVRGELQSQGVKGVLDWKQGAHSIKGHVAVKSNIRFMYGLGLAVDDSSVALDLTAAEVSSPPWFSKPKGVEMVIDVVADSRDQQLWLRRALLRLAHLRLEATGHFRLQEELRGQLDLILPLTVMAGLEKYFTPLAKSPARGEVTGSVNIAGPFRQAEKLTYDLRNLELRKITGNLQYESDGRKVKGPFGADIKLMGQMSPKGVERAGVSGFADLSQLQLEWGTWLKKPPVWRFQLTGQAAKQGEIWDLRQLRLVSQGGNLNLSGRVRPDTAFGFDIQARFENADLSLWSEVARVPDIKLGGILNGQLNLAGKFIPTESLAGSPLALSGNLKWREGILRYIPATTVVATPPSDEATQSALAQPAAWLPSWPLYRQAKLKLDTKFNQVQIRDIKINGVTIVGQVGAGRFQGSGKINDLWGGEVGIGKILLMPLVAPVGMELKGSWQRVDADTLLAWLNPKMKGYMHGKVSGTISASGAVPVASVGFKQIAAEGGLQVTQGVLSTYQIEEKINDSLEKLKLKSKSGVKGRPVPFYAQAGYQLTDGNLNLENFLLTTEKRDELRLQGMIRGDLGVNLTGTVAIANVKVNGAIAAANSDKQGRLVVPLQISGDVRRPEFALSKTTLKTMLTKTVENEAKELGEKLKKDLGKDLKKKLKNIFGQ
ncbi:MAG: hypothetical protein AB7K41_09385 [Bdellovibrionales bacterium]